MRHHVHHSYIWLNAASATLAVLAAALVAEATTAAGLLAGGASAVGVGLAGLAGSFALLVLMGLSIAPIAVFFGLMALVNYVSYRHLYFVLDDAEFTLYRGVFNKKQVHVPYRRVQSVDQHASLLQRIFGVCSVTVDTAGGAANKAVRVPYLTKQQAEWLRLQLFSRKQAMLREQGETRHAGGWDAPKRALDDVVFCGAGAALGGAAVSSTAPATFRAPSQAASIPSGIVCQYGLTVKELVLAGISNSTALAVVAVGVLATLLQILTTLWELFPRVGDSVAEGIADQAIQATDSSTVLLVAGVVGALLALVAIVWAVSAVASCINYGGFHARRCGSRIEVERGLLQHTFQGIDVDRVQSVVVKQSLPRRLIGYCEVSLTKVDAAAEDDGGTMTSGAKGSVVVHPFVKVDRVPEVLHGIIAEYDEVPYDTTPVAKAARRRVLFRRCVWKGGGFWLAAITAVLQLGANFALDLQTLALALGLDLADGVDALRYANMAALALYVLAIIVAAVEAADALQWFRESSFAYNRRFMQVTTGGLSRETVSFPRNKIQYASVRTNPLQRLARTATIDARVAAGVGGTSISLVDVDRDDADAWLGWVEPRETRCSKTGGAADGCTATA